MTTARQDLNKLTLCLNIQVENPVLILNQDAARSFLKESDPKKLYTLFLKATQIETIIDNLHSCLTNVAGSKTRLEHMDRTIRSLEVEIVDVKEKHERLQSVAKLRSKIIDYKNELKWLKVSLVEKDLLETQKHLGENRDNIDKINNFIQNRGKIEKELKEKIRNNGTEYATLIEVVAEKKQNSELRRDEYTKKADELMSADNIQKGFDEKKRQVEKNLEQLKVEIAENDANPLNVDNMRKENTLKIQELEKKKGDVALMLDTARRDQNQFNETLNDVREKLVRGENQKSREQAEVKKFSAQIRQMEGSTKDALAVYGPSMSRMIARIDNMYKKKQFKELPRGPLGQYIEVPETNFKSAVENILGTILTSFYVSCDQDRMQLSKVFKEFPEFDRLQIITGQFQKKVYDVRNGSVQLSGETPGRVLMDVIKVSDPIVMNCLIDQRHIETVVLVQSLDVAVELTQDAEKVPENLSRVILMNPMSEFYPAPSYRSYAMKTNPPRYIQTNHVEVIETMKEQKRGHENKIRDIEVEISMAIKKEKEQEKLLQEKKTLISELQRKDRSYTSQLNDLKSIEYQDENEGDYLQTEAAALVKTLATFNKKIAKNEESLVVLRGDLAQMEITVSKAKNEVNSARQKMTDMLTEIEKAQQQLGEMKTDIIAKQNKLSALRCEETVLVIGETGYQANIDQLMTRITGERVATNRTDEVVQGLIRSAEKRIINIEANHDNIEDVELLLNNKVQQKEKMLNFRDVLDRVLKKMEGIRLSRFHYIKRLRQHMSLRCKHKFNVLMGLRNYCAEIEIDHKEKTLELKVIPRDSEIANAVSNTKSLSGGERSYSTVAFLISLWSCVEHPFYFLDEYDVFSDEYNRKMMTQLLFNEASKKSEKQYGFLTPQDFSNIQASRTITIHKLQDPDRMD